MDWLLSLRLPLSYFSHFALGVERLGVVPTDIASDLMLRLNRCLSFRSPRRDSAALLLPQRKPLKGSSLIRLNFPPTVASETGNTDYYNQGDGYKSEELIKYLDRATTPESKESEF